MAVEEHSQLTDEELQQLASEMVMVADLLEKFSREYEAMVPDRYPWSAAELRHEAVVITDGVVA